MMCLTKMIRNGTAKAGSDGVGVTAELEHTAFGGTYIGGAETGLHELPDGTRVGYCVHAIHADHLGAPFSLFCRGEQRLCLRSNCHPVVIWTCFHAYLYKRFTISIFAMI